MARHLYQCGDCGYQLLPEKETELQVRWIHYQDKKGRPLGGTTIVLRVCASRADCYRRTFDKVSGLGDVMTDFLTRVVEGRGRFL